MMPGADESLCAVKAVPLRYISRLSPSSPNAEGPLLDDQRVREAVWNVCCRLWGVIIVCRYEEFGAWDDFIEADVISLDDPDRSW